MSSVVVVGGGFTGFECARRLARQMRRRKAPVDVTLVSPIDYMLYTSLLPDVAGGVVDARFITIPLAGTLKGARAVRGRVDDVDLVGHTLTFTDPEQRSRSMPWDRLVLTPGSVTRLFDIPGLAKHARGLKSIAEALYLRDHVLEQFELARLDQDRDLAQARRTIVIVGASYSGTELVAQLRVLRRRGIDIRLGTTLKEVHADYVVLSDHSVVGTRTVAWLTGVTAAPLIETLGLPTEKGRLTVQADLAVPGQPDVFSAGDAAAVPDLTQPGTITPPTAQHAIRQGKTLARNVAASLGYGTKTDYRHKNLGLVVDLGPHYAIANPLNIHLSGYPAKFVTRAYHLYAMPRTVNRWAVSLAYLTDLFFARTVLSIGLSTESDAEFSASQGIPLPRAR